jgi:PhoPQ-activated pathogenicity-related protein
MRAKPKYGGHYPETPSLYYEVKFEAKMSVEAFKKFRDFIHETVEPEAFP